MLEDKRRARELALAARRAQSNQDETSLAICQRLSALPIFQTANCILFYVDARSEVRTRSLLKEALDRQRKIAAPYCQGDDLAIARLDHWGELAQGRFNILEPRPELRTLPAKRVDLEELDLVIVPGVAFSRSGARLGHGQGFYDRLLARVQPKASLVGLAYECQVFDELPTETHDIYMNWVITETHVYRGRGRE